MLSTIQSQLETQSIDGWLAYDFRGSNHIALSLLNFPKTAHLTRRAYFWFPKKGVPEALIHRTDEHAHQHLSLNKIYYTSWEELDRLLSERISRKNIAVEYWPQGAIPTYSIIDAGTFEYLKSKQATLTSSWPILAPILYTLDESRQQSHLKAAAILDEIVESSIKTVSLATTEWTLQQTIIQQLKQNNLLFEHSPIVAFGANAALPHYEPTESHSARLTPESVILIDLWGRLNTPQSVYADLTKVFYFGENPSSEITAAYQALFLAQEAAIAYVKTTKYPRGCDIDRICRDIVSEYGFAQYFTHRTGHNITTELHGPGPNIDGFETYDNRTLLPSSCCSLEPGIYIPGKFGLRTECNILILQDFSVMVQGKARSTLPRSV